MDDTAILTAVREADPATTGRIADLLDGAPAAVGDRLADLESAGRVEHEEGKWRLSKDPRLDSSIGHARERLERERR
ncbi:hypothetical protein [Halalkalicoccus subterraneus]|uniref:hypothetical protein n=1 Tax=Halalkalicoccus subterraneus TaxID=2675002 RepID=UPI000EFD952A|nr:hypothetical protein [Halalkalicoccus subterraneus]